jgi:hypothetical protein
MININMEETFEEYLNQERRDFAKVASRYTVDEHLKLRTAIDSLLIAYDQAVEKALNAPNGVSGKLCGYFYADNSTSSATKCICGREEWEHPKPKR